MKLLSAFLALAAADSGCSDTQRKNAAGDCVDKCDLFKVTCSVDDGFSLEVDETCKNAQYSHLDLQNKGSTFFIGDTSIQSSNDAVTPDDECKLSGTYPNLLSDLPFTSCGGFDHTSPEGKDYTVYNAFVNHRETLGDVVTSSMDEIEIECRLQHVSLDTKDQSDGNDGLKITDNDEKDAFDTLESSDLVAALELGLEVGKKTNDVYSALGASDKVDVGSEVTVKLTKKAGTTYLFQLKGCKAYATVAGTATNVPLYTQNNNFCPNAAAVSLVALSQVSYEEFDINVFRIKNAETLTFACSVTVYPEGSTDRTTCSGSGRRRRRSAEASIESATITKTVSIAPEQQSGALQTCANIIVPSVLFMAFL